MDLYSRHIIGWSALGRLKRDLALEALRRAVALRRPRPGVRRLRLLRKRSIELKTMKSELGWRTSFVSRIEATRNIAQYIDGFYNPVGRHSSLGDQSPIAYERVAA
ncbi:MAG: hypothetical protein AAFR21_12205 [Pseudomonadota bacterium]